MFHKVVEGVSPRTTFRIIYIFYDLSTIVCFGTLGSGLRDVTPANLLGSFQCFGYFIGYLKLFSGSVW